MRKLAEAERLIGEGHTSAEAVKQLEGSQKTYYRWRCR